MAEPFLLSSSDLCRLCGEPTKNGIDLYSSEKQCEPIYLLINTYLPIRVENGDQYPKKICPGCHIQLEATKLFLDLIIEGQTKLRNLLKSQCKLIFREEKERIKLEMALKTHNPNTTVETYAIQTDGNDEKYVIQIYSDGPLFSQDHELSLKVAGKNTRRSKKGRPRKSQNDANCYIPAADQKSSTTMDINSSNDGGDIVTTRHKRVIKPPSRYDGDVEGNELTKILTDEGIIDEESELLGEGKLNENFDDSKNNSRTLIGKVFNTSGLLEDEKLVFSGNSHKRPSDRQFKCNICKRVFQQFGRCEAHKRNHKVTYRCQGEGCSFQDPERETVTKHQMETGHEGISAFDSIFQLDGKLMLSNDVISTETSSELTNRPPVKCVICEKEFSCKQNYEVHLKAVHNGEKPFKCSHCDRGFSYRGTLKNHILTHYRKTNGVSPELYKCQSCEKSFNNPSTLRYHRNKEHMNLKFMCIKCNKTFKHRQLLRRHQLVHTECRPYKCGECSKEFKSKDSLDLHENIHKDVVRYICPVCGNTFNQKSSLWSHMKIHDDKKFECDVCRKAFTQKSNLIEHIRTHTGEKPFNCSYCERKFTTSSQCKSHIRRHTGEKPYGCKYCTKKFRHKETLKTHIRRHLNDKPFKCKYCPKSFPEQWACTRHERTHLGTIIYKCSECDKGFSDRTNYCKHRNRHLKKDIAIKNSLQDKETVSPILTAKKITVKNETQSDDAPTKESSTDTCTEVVYLPDITTENVKSIETNANLQFQLLDQDGNSINLTTVDGKSIPIVSSGEKKFEGLLPDGTLVSFDIICNGQIKEEKEIVAESKLAIASEVSLVDTEVHYIEDNTNPVCTGNRQAFLTDDDKVCFITTFDENSFLNIS